MSAAATRSPDMVKFTGRSGLTILLLADALTIDTLTRAFTYGCFGKYCRPDLIWMHSETMIKIFPLAHVDADIKMGQPVMLTLLGVDITRNDSMAQDMVLFYLPVEAAAQLISHSQYISNELSAKTALKHAKPTQPIVEVVISKELLNAHVASRR